MDLAYEYDARADRRPRMIKPKNFNERDEWLLQTKEESPRTDLALYKYKNATVYGDGSVFVTPFKVVPESLRAPEMERVYSLKRCLKQLFYSKRTGKKDRVYINVNDHWGFEFYHWFADAMPRLIYALEHYKPQDVTIILSEKHKYDYIEGSLKRLGITDVVYLQRKEKLFCPQLVLPSFTAPNGHHHTELIKKIRDLFVVPALPQRKIYITRRSARFRKITNEFELTLLVQKHGFEIIEMEKVSFDDKIQMMSASKALLSIYGAGLTNALFMQKGTSVIELRKNTLGKNINRRTKVVTAEKLTFQNTYYRLSSALELNYTYLLCDSPQPDNEAFKADITVNLDELSQILQTLN